MVKRTWYFDVESLGLMDVVVRRNSYSPVTLQQTGRVISTYSNFQLHFFKCVIFKFSLDINFSFNYERRV